MKLLNFKSVEINGKFVHKNCLFIKGENNMAKIQGSNNPITFQDDQEVGVVVDVAYAPSNEPEVNEAPEREEHQEEGED